ncbi:hypothetical protein [Frankia sp. AgB32]|uniref:hypothetical protein n=1 Tax=Frankia sp. AgB32 TaxID=631119 RepID=UPI00200F3B0D|nr:hypothetical protein [Frankia sp. AgB32]MCK9896851.1 hypothetical protein [Frankia sp. AgB32]
MTIAAGVLAIGPAAGAATPDEPAAAVGRAVQPLLLTGDNQVTQATDISPAGAVVGTSGPLPPPVITGPLGPKSGWRWLVPPVAGPALAQRLTVPAGTVGVEVNGVTDLGEAGGVVIGPANYDRQPVRWSVAGTRTTALAPGPDEGSQVTTVGPAQWGVFTGDSISGASAIVARDGTRTELHGTPDLADARIITALSIAGPRTALLGTISGVGRGSRGRTVIWQDGATLALPTFGQLDLPQLNCASAIQPDGTVAYSGIVSYSPDTGFTRALTVRRGGLAGADIALPTAGRVGSLSCSSLDALSGDGWVAGYLFDASATPAPEAAALWHVAGGATPALTTIPVRAGETKKGTRAVAVASRGRAVVVATTADGVSTPWLWSNGARTPLALPAGWTLRNVVEMTDSGLILANVRNSDGAVRPVVWRTGG